MVLSTATSLSEEFLTLQQQTDDNNLASNNGTSDGGDRGSEEPVAAY